MSFATQSHVDADIDYLSHRRRFVADGVEKGLVIFDEQ